MLRYLLLLFVIVIIIIVAYLMVGLYKCGKQGFANSNSIPLTYEINKDIVEHTIRLYWPQWEHKIVKNAKKSDKLIAIDVMDCVISGNSAIVKLHISYYSSGPKVHDVIKKITFGENENGLFILDIVNSAMPRPGVRAGIEHYSKYQYKVPVKSTQNKTENFMQPLDCKNITSAMLKYMPDKKIDVITTASIDNKTCDVKYIDYSGHVHKEENRRVVFTPDNRTDNWEVLAMGFPNSGLRVKH